MKMRGTIIFPETFDDLNRTQHFLWSRNRPFRTLFIATDDSGEQAPMVMTEMDFIEQIVFKNLFGVKTEKMNVFG